MKTLLKQWALFCLMIACLAGPTQKIKAEQDLTVNFSYKGTVNTIKGEKLSDNSFLFNKGATKKIKIATLDWAPYIGQDICKQGWVQQLTIAILASQGYEITSAFYPWARAVSNVEKGTEDLLYPEYFIESEAPSDVVKGSKRLDNLALSGRFPGGPLAFMKRKGETDHYQGDFQNLKGEKIGVVSGYQNTPEFDSLMDQGFFSTDKATDDLINAKKLVNKRINLIIGDPAVIRFTIATSLKDAEAKSILNQLETVKPLIQYNHLYFALSKKKSDWALTLELINRTIAEFEASGEMFRIIQNTNKACNMEMETLTPYQVN
ncbi:MAG: transporter substrate-binding domain-containing protein [SAR324 cluster bacterium]|nr:transporter substrate-binding domain-containing protein [SAR324 cluster bacterium]